MKRLLVCAMAAIVALASCSKTELVDNSAPTPISFKAVTGSVTKAGEAASTTATATLAGNSDMGVFAYVHDNNEKKQYFLNDKFVHSSGTTWSGSHYWPLQSKLDFVVYSPYRETSNESNASNVTYDLASKTLSVPIDFSTFYTVTNGSYSVNGVSTKQIDYLYGVDYFDNIDGLGYNSSNTVNTKLNHALSQITIQFKGSNVTVNSAKLNNFYSSTGYDVAYTATTPTVNWKTLTSTGKELKIANINDIDVNDSVTSATSATFLVIPSASSKLTIYYTIDNTLASLPAVIDLTNNGNISTWEHGKHYIYTIDISPVKIELTPSVNIWSEVVSPNN